MAPDTPEREPEMQELSPCQRPEPSRHIVSTVSILKNRPGGDAPERQRRKPETG